MISKKLNENNIGINISRTIITIALIFSIYTFFGKEQIGAKLLSVGGFIGFLFLLIMSFKSSLKSKGKNEFNGNYF
ncbi:hypothetical protein NSA56_10680 [Oceanobacillus caeni]|uniref:hypothetical protein n=1 Tax=Oceanobacillus caeni TaxID=405946 RepID=UPI00214A202E|nr:hypothetical protein [Oceanobacillus caeni]MCR1834863.1 hypothetical protein [Oceanobacillus caeni]